MKGSAEVRRCLLGDFTVILGLSFYHVYVSVMSIHLPFLSFSHDYSSVTSNPLL